MKRLTTRLAMNPAWTLGQHTECSGGVSSLFCRMHELGWPVENLGKRNFFWTDRVRPEQLMKGWISTTEELVALVLN